MEVDEVFLITVTYYDWLWVVLVLCVRDKDVRNGVVLILRYFPEQRREDICLTRQLFCSRCRETSGGTSVQQRGGLSFWRRQETPSGENWTLTLLTARVMFLEPSTLFTPGYEPGALENKTSSFPSVSFSAQRRRLNCRNVNGWTHIVKTASNTMLLLFYPAVLSHVNTSRVEVTVVSAAELPTNTNLPFNALCSSGGACAAAVEEGDRNSPRRPSAHPQRDHRDPFLWGPHKGTTGSASGRSSKHFKANYKYSQAELLRKVDL